MIYAWQQTIWTSLTDAFSTKKLPHALLFSGVAGIGKAHFVNELTRFIMCEKKQVSHACLTKENCHACRLVQTNVHPNIHSVLPEKVGHAIKIDQIRELIEFANHSAYMSDAQCIVINPAHQMNIFAANSLLKTLEEPSPNVFIFLITNECSRLPATILSRTIHVDMPVPSKEAALAWLGAASKKSHEELLLALKLASYAPLKALSLLQSNEWKVRALIYQTICVLQKQPETFMQSTLALQDIESLVFLDCLLSWIIDATKIKCGIHMTHIDNYDYTEELGAFAQSLSLQNLDQLLHRISSIRHDVVRGVYLNKTLIVENVLIHFMRNDYGLS